MEVDKINKIFVEENTLKKESGVKASTSKGKKCLLDPLLECTAPNCKYDICANCPYGYLTTFTSSVKNVYQRIIGLAIFLLNRNR